MSEMIKCYVKAPGGKLQQMDLDNEVGVFQGFVGGYIEVVHITRNIVMICTEEGKLRNMEPNFGWLGDVIVGPVIFCGVDGEEFADMPLEFSEFKPHFEAIAKEVRHG